MPDQEHEQPTPTGLGAVGKGTASTPQPQTPEDEPMWTTGQGIGFLVALPGWLLVAIGLLGAGPASELGGEGVVIALVAAGFGILIAIPGSIVFNKCKRQPLKRQATTSKHIRKGTRTVNTPRDGSRIHACTVVPVMALSLSLLLLPSCGGANGNQGDGAGAWCEDLDRIVELGWTREDGYNYREKRFRHEQRRLRTCQRIHERIQLLKNSMTSKQSLERRRDRRDEIRRPRRRTSMGEGPERRLLEAS